MSIDSPPSSRIPTSKETRVRVDGLEKISAHVCPASGLDEILPRFVLNSAVRRKMRSISSREICSMLSKCFIGSLFFLFFFLLLLLVFGKIDYHLFDGVQSFIGFAFAQI